MFTNGPGDRDSITGRVIPKTQEKKKIKKKKAKGHQVALTLSIIRYGSRVSSEIQRME